MGKIGVLLSTIAAIGIGFAIGTVKEFVKQEKRLDESDEQIKKWKSFYRLLVQWVSLKQDGKNLSEYLEFNGYNSIAIYGMRELGERLIEELKNTNIKVEYIIDQNADKVITKLPKYKPEDELPKVDAIVVTAIYYYQDIEESLSEHVGVGVPIISLEDVVYGLA